MNNQEKFELCFQQASLIVKNYRDEAPEDCDPQNSWAAIAVAAAGVGSAYLSSRSAKSQAGASQDALNRVMSLFKKQRPGDEALGGIASLLEGLDIESVDPMAFKDAGFDLTDDAMDFMRAEGLETFAAALGGNYAAFEQLTQESLELANWDFSSVPDDVLATLDNSALSRASGGPIGRAEEISVGNRMALKQSGEQSAHRQFAFKAGFLPELINPIDTTMDLARFEQQNQQLQLQAAGLEMQALGALYKGEMDQFSLESGLVGFADPTAGLGTAALASGLNTAALALGTYYANSGSTTRNQTPTQTSTTTSTDWRTSARGPYG